MEEVDHSPERPRPTRLSHSGPDSGGNPYGVMVEKFARHVRQPGTGDDDDNDGPFINRKPYFSGNPETILQDELFVRHVRQPGTGDDDDNDGPFINRKPYFSGNLETILQDEMLARHVRQQGTGGDDDNDGPFINRKQYFSGNLETILQDDDGPLPPFTNLTSRRSVPIVGSSPDLLHVPSNMLETILQDGSSRPQNIPLQDLKEITDNFSDERILGQGGFGVVYKGVLRNGKTIAVKKIVSSLMPGLQKQFESEVYHLMMLKHPNIVRCVGYCYEIQNACLEYNGKYVFAETAERLLCLEHMPKGSLDKYLSDESSGLDWSTRYNIIEGICYGLCHLHEQMDKPIIHLDLKPANILLDDGMVPKITDFGLSRLLDQQQTICTSSRDGTFGYMAPEFLHGGTITPKSDIFSLGVIIMEVVTGHRDYPDITRTSSDDFIKLALEKWRNVLQRSQGYGSLETDCEQVKRCIQVGLICVNPDRTKRPPITKVINMLQGSESIDYDISKGAV